REGRSFCQWRDREARSASVQIRLRPRRDLRDDGCPLGHVGGFRYPTLRNIRTADQSGLMFANLITFAHLSVSSAMNLPNSADELADSSTPPRPTMRALMAGSEMARVISLLSRSTISAGVFLGAPKPIQALAS